MIGSQEDVITEHNLQMRKWENFHKLEMAFPRTLYGVPVELLGRAIFNDPDVNDDSVSDEMYLSREEQYALFLRRKNAEEARKREKAERENPKPIKKMSKAEKIKFYEKIAMKYFLAAFKAGKIAKSVYKSGLIFVVNSAIANNWPVDVVKNEAKQQISAIIRGPLEPHPDDIAKNCSK